MSRSLWYHFTVSCETLWSEEEKLQVLAIKKADTKPVLESRRAYFVFLGAGCKEFLMLKRKTACLDGRAESLDTKTAILLHVSYELITRVRSVKRRMPRQIRESYRAEVLSTVVPFGSEFPDGRK